MSLTLSDCRKLYLDLVTNCVLGLIYEDPPVDAWSGGKFQAELRAEGRDWPGVAHSMIGAKRMKSLRALCEDVLERGVPGDFIETGVWRGGACILMRAVLEAHGERERVVWCADSFQGLPPPNAASFPADAGDTHSSYEALAVSLDSVKTNFARYGLLDDQVRFLRGWFRDTLPTAPVDALAILRLDGDMYESTMDSLQALFHKVSPGGYVIVDDMGAIPACRQAVLDFRAAQSISDPICRVDWTGAYWQKT